MPRHASALVVALFLSAAALPQAAAAQEAATSAEPPAPAEPAAAAQPPAPAQPARVSTGLVTIESDQQRADQLTGVITATGNVRIVYPDERVVATARQAQYFSKENRVVLSGDVDIVQEGGNLIRAERVMYLVDGERLIAIPPTGQQVFSRVRIQQTPPASPAATPAAAPAPAPAAQP
jgi:lipopolysaccharide export system protein LptA